MKKILSIIYLVIATISVAFADDVTFQANAPKQVIMGKPFQLSYSVNQRAKDLRAPEMEAFDVLAGPYTSQSSSMSFTNGQRTSTFNMTFTYTLMATKEGTFTIAPATITVGRDQYRSNGLKITVLPQDEQPARQTQNQQAQRQQSGNDQSVVPTGIKVDGENIFMKTQVTKTKVHEQECILLSYKIYWAGVELAQFTNNTKIPEFKGFLKQDLEQGEIQTNLEHYNGRNYNTAVIYQTLLYPQKAGDVVIEPASFEAILRVPNRAQVRSIFDDFFGSYTNVSKVLTAPGTTIHVSSLPSGKPAGFSGGVGHFDITSSITQQSITTNDAVTIHLGIKGTGNLKLIKTPTVDWPEGFEVYDPKVNNNFKNTTAGITGTKQIEYLAIARAAGDYTIPPIEFSYFDTQTGEYKRLTTEAYTIHVARGAGESENAVVQTYTQKEDIKQLGSDIRFIYTGEYSTPKEGVFGDFKSAWYLFFLIPLLIDLLLVIFFRKKIRENSDENRVRYKKANKVAQKRLKAAKKLLNEGTDNAFYEEIERAAWQYLSDRLSIPTAELSKDNIAELLAKKGVTEELIRQTKDVLSTAEFARYAPSAAGSKEQLYESTVRIIDQLEDTKI